MTKHAKYAKIYVSIAVRLDTTETACVRMGVSMPLTIRDLQLPKSGSIENISSMGKNPFVIEILELLSRLFGGMNILFNQLKFTKAGNQKIISIKEIKDTSILINISPYHGMVYNLELYPKDENINTFINNIKIFITLVNLKSSSQTGCLIQYIERMFRTFTLLKAIKQKEFTCRQIKDTYPELFKKFHNTIYANAKDEFIFSKNGQIFSWTDEFLNLYYGEKLWPMWAVETPNEQIKLDPTVSLPCYPELTLEELTTLKYISEYGHIVYPNPKFVNLERIQLLESSWVDGDFKEPLKEILEILFDRGLISVEGNKETLFEEKLYYIPDIVAFEEFVNCYGINVLIKNLKVVEEKTKAPEVIPDHNSKIYEPETFPNLIDPVQEIPEKEKKLITENIANGIIETFKINGITISMGQAIEIAKNNMP